VTDRREKMKKKVRLVWIVFPRGGFNHNQLEREKYSRVDQSRSEANIEFRHHVEGTELILQSSRLSGASALPFELLGNRS
jgi:hypothetical protein